MDLSCPKIYKIVEILHTGQMYFIERGINEVPASSESQWSMIFFDFMRRCPHSGYVVFERVRGVEAVSTAIAIHVEGQDGYGGRALRILVHRQSLAVGLVI